MKNKKLGSLVCTALYLSMIVGAASAKDADLSLTMEHFRDTATVVDVPQNAAVQINTERGFSDKRGPLHSVWNDEFFVADIDRKTEKKSFQVIVWVTYAGRERYYQKVTFDTPQGAKTVTATRISSKKEYCTDEDCTFTERLSFPVDEETLRHLASGAASSALWSFKVSGRSGTDYTGVLSNAEAAGLLAKVDAYGSVPLQAAPAPSSSAPAVAAVVARTAQKAALGIEGLQVAGDPDHPNRRGVLITAVASEGVARRSNLIVGDIVYEVNGRSIKTLGDLQQAVAGVAANASIVIKLYRGLTDTQMTAQF